MRDHEYTAGGWILRMSTDAARRWNSGDLTPQDEASILVWDEQRHGDDSFVRDGEVVVVQGMPGGDWRPLRESDWDGEYGLDGETLRHRDGRCPGCPADGSGLVIRGGFES